MKSKLKRTIYHGVGFILILVMVTACSSSLPEGEIKAELIKDGELFINGAVYLISFEDINVFLSDGETEATLFGFNTNESGILLAKDMPAGKYILGIIAARSGHFNIHAVYQGNAPFIFELPEKRGVDLGVVDISKNNPVYFNSKP